jgi:hypothetical protein
MSVSFWRVSVLTMLACCLALPVSDALADACDQANDRFNAAANSNNFQYGAKFQELFGRALSMPQLPQECRQYLALLQWRLARQPSLVQLQNAADAVCHGNNVKTQGASPAGINANSNAADLLAGLQSDYAAAKKICSGAAATTKPTRPACVTPAAGTVFADQGLQCIRASNTNSEPTCRYSFSFVGSIQGRNSGPVVEAGKTDTSVCGRPGETMQFDRWKLLPVNAR